MRKEQDPAYETITGWSTPHGDSLVLHRCIVDPTHQHKGIFHAMMTYAIQEASKLGLHSIKIDTHHDNYKMRRFLEKHGFIHIGYLEVINREAYELVWEDTK